MATKMEGQADRVQRYATTGRVLLTLSENDNIMDSQKNAKELTSMPRPKGSKNKKTAVIIGEFIQKESSYTKRELMEKLNQRVPF